MPLVGQGRFAASQAESRTGTNDGRRAEIVLESGEGMSESVKEPGSMARIRQSKVHKTSQEQQQQ